MAKGLEFDQVIIPHVTAKNYHTDLDRSLLYIAVTRAMHGLTLTWSGAGGSAGGGPKISEILRKSL